MDATKIRNPDELGVWLADKPVDWAKAIALRAALRALPFIATSSEHWLANFTLLPFGAVVTSWAQLTEKSIDVLKTGRRANARFGGLSFDFASYNIEQIARLAAESCYHSADAQTNSVHVFSDCTKGVFQAAEVFRHGFRKNRYTEKFSDSDDAVFWKSVELDCQLLIGADGDGLAKSLAEIRLWDHWPDGWEDQLSQLVQSLHNIDQNFSVWIEWYTRRIVGEEAAFDIPGDKDREEDKKILLRLAEATDENFWGKGHEYVNATLTGWLDEARTRVAPPLELGNQEPDLPTQNSNVLSFRTDEFGRIAVDETAQADLLRTDAAARDRHAEAVGEARLWLDRCFGNNAAARLTRFLENYLEAAGDNIEGVRPSLLVQRGERLRQELARYDAPDHMLAPVADDLLLDGKGWQAAHNMLVGLDPVLMASDTAMLGPDRGPALIPPEEIRLMAHEADEAGLLAEGVIEIIDETVDLAPAIPDRNDRRTIFSTEMVSNLLIEILAMALNHPVATGAVVAMSAVLSSGLVAGIVGSVSIMGTIKAAEYLVTHRDWILSRFGNTPTWQALITRLVDWLEKVTPFEPK